MIDKLTKSAESRENASIHHQEDNQVTPKQSEIPSSTSDWQPGETILETYEVKAILGKGGFGKVYRVHHKNWNIDLAVKRALNMQEDGKQSFIQEAQNWIDLGLHPHIISCYYVRNIDGFPHTFAELAEGGSLHSWIQRNNFNLYEGNKDQILRRILDIAIQFAWGLAFAHQQGLIHQDVKPQNALMMPGGVLKVTDFGLTKAKSALQQNTGESAMGDLLVSGGAYSPFHCSPEQVEHKKLSDCYRYLVLGCFYLGDVQWRCHLGGRPRRQLCFG